MSDFTWSVKYEFWMTVFDPLFVPSSSSKNCDWHGFNSFLRILNHSALKGLAAVWSDIRKCQTQHEKVVKNCYWVWLSRKTCTWLWNKTETFFWWLTLQLTHLTTYSLLFQLMSHVLKNVVTTLLMFLSKWVPNCGVLILTGDRSRGSPGATSVAAVGTAVINK